MMTPVKTVKYSYLTVTDCGYCSALTGLEQWIRTGRSGFGLLCFICCDEPPCSFTFCFKPNAWLVSHAHLVMLQHSWRAHHLSFSSPTFHCCPEMRPNSCIVASCQSTNGLKKRKTKTTSSSRYTGIWLITWHKKNWRTLKCQLSLRWLSIINITLTCLHLQKLDLPENWIYIYTDVCIAVCSL